MNHETHLSLTDARSALASGVVHDHISRLRDIPVLQGP